MYEPFIKFAMERWQDYLLPQWDKYYESLGTLCQKGCTIGVIGLQSVGKSTLLNACLGYPVLPSLLTRGTTCPVFVEWGEHPALTVHLQRGTRKAAVSLPTQLSAEMFEALLGYVCFCVNQKIFFPDNLYYFFCREKATLVPDDIELHVDNPKHTLLLLLILLNAHMDGAGNIGAAFKQAAEKRKALLRMLSLDEGTITMLHLSWENSILQNGVRLLDLPGLGSGREDDFLAFVTMAKQMDVLMCLTTKESVLGDLGRALDVVYKEGDPLIVLVVNRAEEISNAEIAINSARQMIWPKSSACYLLSAVAGEAQYLAQGICVERTRYWREIALPEFLRFSKDAVVSESLKASAAQELSGCFSAEYQCVEQNGEAFFLSLDGFVKNTLPQIAGQGEWKRFSKVFQSNVQAAECLKQLTKKEILFYSAFLKNLNPLWDKLTQMCVSTFHELKTTCCQEKEQLCSVRESYQASLQLFTHSWDGAIGKLNRDFSLAVGEKCKQVPSCFGLGVCRCDNDTFLQELAELSDAFDYDLGLRPVLDVYRDAFHHAEESMLRTSKRLRDAMQRCTSGLYQTLDYISQAGKDLGYDPSLFFRYYGNPMEDYVMDILENTEREFASVELSVDVCPTAPDFHWRERGWAFVWERIQDAVLWRGAGVFVLRKRRVLERFSESLISPVMSDQLSSLFLCPEPEKDVVRQTELLIQTCEVLGETADREKEGRMRQATVLSQSLRDAMVSDFARLRGWDEMI